MLMQKKEFNRQNKGFCSIFHLKSTEYDAVTEEPQIASWECASYKMRFLCLLPSLNYQVLTELIEEYLATFLPTNWKEDIKLPGYENKLLKFKLIYIFKKHWLLSPQSVFWK